MSGCGLRTSKPCTLHCPCWVPRDLDSCPLAPPTPGSIPSSRLTKASWTGGNPGEVYGWSLEHLQPVTPASRPEPLLMILIPVLTPT